MPSFHNAFYFLLALLPLAHSPSKKPGPYKESRPNIIYIYADDMGYGELGCYGQQKIKTPNLDRMAAEGMRFTQHYTSTPVCAPARCMLMTGKHGGHSFIRGNYEMGGFADSLEGGQMPLPEGTFTMAKMLKGAGYTTGAIGKWGLGMSSGTGDPNKQGFDYFYGYLDQKQAHNYYPTHLWENGKWDTLDNAYIDVHKKLTAATASDKDFEYFSGQEYAPANMTKKALNFIQKNKEKPFFLYLPYTIPHVSLQAPKEYIDRYIGKFDEQPYYGQNNYASTKFPLSTYAAMITYLDDQVALIMQQIKMLGIDENTLIMFSSDNGATFNGGVNRQFFNSNGGLRGEKMDLYEGGIREPFIARWPKQIAAGSVSDHPSIQYDLMATLAELTNQQAGHTDGISFLPELLGRHAQQKTHPYFYFEYPEKGGQIAIRKGVWKGIRVNVRTNASSPWQLYNLEQDRNETTDLAKQHPELLKQFEAIVAKEHQPATIKEWEFIHPKFAGN